MTGSGRRWRRSGCAPRRRPRCSTWTPRRGRRQLEALGDEIRVALADVRRLVDGPPAARARRARASWARSASRRPPRRRHGHPEPGVAAIRVESDPVPMPELPAAVEVAAYRIAVEAMTNAVRHAGPGCAGSRLDGRRPSSRSRSPTTAVACPATLRPGTGLESMRERAEELGGDVAFEPRPGGGTRVLARLPLARRGRHDRRARDAATAPIRVLVADDHAAFRAGLRALLETADGRRRGRARRTPARRPWRRRARSTPTSC